MKYFKISNKINEYILLIIYKCIRLRHTTEVETERERDSQRVYKRRQAHQVHASTIISKVKWQATKPYIIVHGGPGDFGLALPPTSWTFVTWKSSLAVLSVVCLSLSFTLSLSLSPSLTRLISCKTKAKKNSPSYKLTCKCRWVFAHFSTPLCGVSTQTRSHHSNSPVQQRPMDDISIISRACLGLSSLRCMFERLRWFDLMLKEWEGWRLNIGEWIV